MSDTIALSKTEIHFSDLTPEAKFFVDLFNLQPHPEGGYYVQLFESNHVVTSTDMTRYEHQNRRAGTSIYYLLNRSDFSAWHRLKSDEIWHYYKGSDVIIYLIDRENNLRSYQLGDPGKDSKASFQISIPSDTWFSAELVDKESYGLVGCTVSPGFQFADFELGDRDLLLQQFPQHESFITKLTRGNSGEEHSDD